MSSRKKSYKIKVILSLSNINADFLQLILCMFVSHFILNNPFYGAALFLFANIWTLYFQGNLSRISSSHRSRAGVLMWLLLAASVISGLAIVFLYPIIKKAPDANFVSFFVAMVAARTVLTAKVNNTFNKPRRSHRVYKAIFQILFLIPCAAFAFWLMPRGQAWAVLASFAITGLLVSYQSSTLASFGKYISNQNRDKMGEIASYRIFSNMTLYSQVAFSLGMLMYICYVSFRPQSFSMNTYIMMTLWIIVILYTSEFFTWLVKRQGWVLGLNIFILGAAMWTVGSVKMYDADGLWSSGLWTMFWGFGLACITSALNLYNSDFKMVARIANRKVSDRDLYFRSLLTQVIAVIFSNAVMLGILTFWAFVVPNFSDGETPLALRRLMVQLPILFMIVSVIFALRQPLDRRSRQKLVNYSAGTSQNKPTKKSLEKRLVEKNRVRFGVKIIAFFVRPFLRLKVSGQENMDQENFPSIFVCNHGIIYGPIAAVIYLPTYFRPWIDRKMVDRDMAAREMCGRFIYRIPLLSKKAKMWIAHQLSRPVTWALNSFNPIPVEKNNMRNVMSTFNDTVQVLSEGDNVLIFPEKPRRVKRGNKMTVEHETSTVGTLFTGFANIGSLYYEKTGKILRFYPLYANKKGHTFRIGEPVIFRPENDPREEKQRIAETLHDKMLELRTKP